LNVLDVSNSAGGRFRNQIRTQGFAYMSHILETRETNVLSDLNISRSNVRD